MGQVLSLNPFAVYISLVRVGYMSSYRTDSAGNQPFNNGLCQQFLDVARPRAHPPRHHGSDHADRSRQQAVEHRDPQERPALQISNVPLQAYCHAIVTNNDLWIAAVGWGVVVFAVGIVFFWRAEHLYGRG